LTNPTRYAIPDVSADALESSRVVKRSVVRDGAILLRRYPAVQLRCREHRCDNVEEALAKAERRDQTLCVVRKQTCWLRTPRRTVLGIELRLCLDRASLPSGARAEGEQQCRGCQNVPHVSVPFSLHLSRQSSPGR